MHQVRLPDERLHLERVPIRAQPRGSWRSSSSPRVPAGPILPLGQPRSSSRTVAPSRSWDLPAELARGLVVKIVLDDLMCSGAQVMLGCAPPEGARPGSRSEEVHMRSRTMIRLLALAGAFTVATAASSRIIVRERICTSSLRDPG